MKKENVLEELAYLIHITHYDPAWYDRKKDEKQFDLSIGLEMVDALAENKFNVLIIDVEDGVIFKSHPELKRHYSIQMEQLRVLVNRARSKGLEIIPKLNFSKAKDSRWDHNVWFRPHNRLPDNKKYFKLAFELIDELIKVCRPERYFFIGMDEDILREDAPYVRAIKELDKGLKKRGLKSAMWSDSARQSSGGIICAKKAIAAENSISKDVLQCIWDYGPVRESVKGHIKELVKKGFNVWIAPSPGGNPKLIQEWKDVAVKSGCKGMLMTRWAPVSEKNRTMLLNAINNIGSLYARGRSKAKEIDCPLFSKNYLSGATDKKEYLISPEYYIRNWMTLGPIRFDPKKYEGKEQQSVIFDPSFVGGKEETLVSKKQGTREYGAVWKKYIPSKGTYFTNRIYLSDFYGGYDYTLAYLVANVYSPKDVKGYKMYLGSDDYIKVWVNGEMVYIYNEGTRSTLQDSDKAGNISLKKGWNTILVKSVNISGGWDFILRLTDENDRAIKTMSK